MDLDAGTLTVRHIVTNTSIEGKQVLVQADRAKTKSSLRTLPLVDAFAQRLHALKEQQEYNEQVCGSCYNQKYKGYLFVNEMGDLVLPNSVTDGFARLLAENVLRKIRFHDLRHPNVKPKTKIFYPLFLNKLSCIQAHRSISCLPVSLINWKLLLNQSP